MRGATVCDDPQPKVVMRTHRSAVLHHDCRGRWVGAGLDVRPEGHALLKVGVCN
jgi:hypothetical protein